MAHTYTDYDCTDGEAQIPDKTEIHILARESVKCIESLQTLKYILARDSVKCIESL